MVWHAARAFSGEVGTGSPQKMRPLKDDQSEFRFHWNGIRSNHCRSILLRRRKRVPAFGRVRAARSTSPQRLSACKVP